MFEIFQLFTRISYKSKHCLTMNNSKIPYLHTNINLVNKFMQFVIPGSVIPNTLVKLCDSHPNFCVETRYEWKFARQLKKRDGMNSSWPVQLKLLYCRKIRTALRGISVSFNRIESVCFGGSLEMESRAKISWGVNFYTEIYTRDETFQYISSSFEL